MKDKTNLKPMPLWQSLLLFGVPSACFFISIYIFMPLLGRKLIDPIVNYTLTLTGPVVLLFCASLIAFKLEGNLLKWSVFKRRFRLKRLKARGWRWTIGLSLLMIVSNFILMPTQDWLLSVSPLSPPDYLPSTIDPRIVVEGIPPEFASTSLLQIITFQVFFLFFNIFGEEFWWRGYILPRQELTHGKYTWIIHGILWTLFHSFWFWNLLFLLPGALAASFAAQRLKNTTVIIVVHLIVNTIGGTVLLLFST